MADAAETDFGGVIALMARSNVECILIGGLAATVHGSAHLTYDIDFCYKRTPENLERLASSLAPYRPYLRGAPEGLPFEWSAALCELAHAHSHEASRGTPEGS